MQLQNPTIFSIKQVSPVSLRYKFIKIILQDNHWLIKLFRYISNSTNANIGIPKVKCDIYEFFQFIRFKIEILFKLKRY